MPSSKTLILALLVWFFIICYDEKSKQNQTKSLAGFSDYNVWTYAICSLSFWDNHIWFIAEQPGLHGIFKFVKPLTTGVSCSSIVHVRSTCNLLMWGSFWVSPVGLRLFDPSIYSVHLSKMGSLSKVRYHTYVGMLQLSR